MTARQDQSEDATTKVDAKADPGSDTKADAKADAGSDAGADAKADPGAEAKADAKADPGADAEVGLEAAPAAPQEPAAGEPATKAGPPAPDDAADGAARRRFSALTMFSGRTGKIVASVLLVVLLAVGAGGVLWYRGAHVPDGVAYRVFDTEVTTQELDEQLLTLKALYGVAAPKEESRLDGFRRDMAKASAASMVLDRAAVDMGVAVADRQATDVLTRFVAESYGEGQAGRDQFVQALAQAGTSEAKVLGEIKRQLTVRELFNRVTAGVTVSDEELRVAFDERRDQLGTPELRELQNIVVKSRSEADQIVAELAAGASFEALAQQRSLDGATKAQGGNLGLVAARQLERAYADAAFGAPVGAVFGPVQTQFGFNVGKVVRSQPPAAAEFDKVKDQLRQVLVAERATAQWRTFMSDKLREADVVYADAYRPADPDALPAPPGPAPAPGPGTVPAPGAAPGPEAPPVPAPAPGSVPAPAPGDQPIAPR
ncbi:MAG: peptidyl-prolyl cis-trans isomerase [Pseudonocardia sp.]